MIFIALLVFVLARFLPKWFFKERYNSWLNNFSWKIPVFDLSGLFFSLTLAMVLTVVLTMSTKDTYVKNENAIYGLEFNEVMEQIGFVDGTKLISINGKKIDRVSDIVSKIIFEDGEVVIAIDRDGETESIVLDENEKLGIIQSGSSGFIRPILEPKNKMNNGQKPIEITVENFGFKFALSRFGRLWKQAVVLIKPRFTNYREVGGYVALSKAKDIRGHLLILAFNLILVGILNLLPLPGFSVGNSIISCIEIKRRKHFNKRKKSIVGFISITMIIILIIMSLFL